MLAGALIAVAAIVLAPLFGAIAQAILGRTRWYRSGLPGRTTVQAPLRSLVTSADCSGSCAGSPQETVQKKATA